MTTVNDFLETNLNVDDLELEKSRLAKLISDIPQLSEEEKQKLARGFLDCVLNDKAEISKRIRAALFLGNESAELNIVGSREILENLSSFLENELSINKYWKKPTYLEFNFLKQVVFAVYYIDPLKGALIVRNLLRCGLSDEVASWLNGILDKRG
jgi:hypothetical protein